MPWRSAIRAAQAEKKRPTLICCRTEIGYPAPTRGGTAKAHGEPLGAEEVAAVRKLLNWTDPPFVVPAPLRDAWDCRAQGRAAEQAWQEAVRALPRAVSAARCGIRAPHAGRIARAVADIARPAVCDGRGDHRRAGDTRVIAERVEHDR